jgi:hypothetical protein
VQHALSRVAVAAIGPWTEPVAKTGVSPIVRRPLARVEGRHTMRFIVPPQKEEQQDCKKQGQQPSPFPDPCLSEAHTLCALCSEDPRFCPSPF